MRNGTMLGAIVGGGVQNNNAPGRVLLCYLPLGVGAKTR